MTREEAIGNLKHAIRWNDMPEKEALEMAIKALEQTEPERPHGKWRSLDNDTVICSKCFYIYHGMILPDYCPRCHAKMTRGFYEDMTEVQDGR